MSTRLAVAQSIPAYEPRLCAACAQPIRDAYYKFPERTDVFCEQCIATRPRCTSCAAPVGSNGWKLHDGRMQCARCHATAIYDPSEASELFKATVRRLELMPGLRLSIGVDFRLIDAPTMAEISDRAHISHEQHLNVIGLYVRDGPMRVVYALYGLTRLVFREVVAHEYAHAWQGEYCPLLRDNAWREGSAEWVAYLHLRDLGATKAAERLRNPAGPYAAWLEECLQLEASVGVAGVLQALRRME